MNNNQINTPPTDQGKDDGVTFFAFAIILAAAISVKQTVIPTIANMPTGGDPMLLGAVMIFVIAAALVHLGNRLQSNDSSKTDNSADRQGANSLITTTNPMHAGTRRAGSARNADNTSQQRPSNLGSIRPSQDNANPDSKSITPTPEGLSS
jgi:hypothetical protein